MRVLPGCKCRELPVWVSSTGLVVGILSLSVACCPGGTGVCCPSEESQISESNNCLITCARCRTTSQWMSCGGSCLLTRLNTALPGWPPTMAVMLSLVPWTTCPSPQPSTAKVTFNFFLSHHTLPPLSPVQHTLFSLCKATSAPLFFVFSCFASDNRSHF